MSVIANRALLGSSPSARAQFRLEAVGITISRYGLVLVLLLNRALEVYGRGSGWHSTADCEQPAHVMDVRDFRCTWRFEFDRHNRNHRCLAVGAPASFCGCIIRGQSRMHRDISVDHKSSALDARCRGVELRFAHIARRGTVLD